MHKGYYIALIAVIVVGAGAAGFLMFVHSTHETSPLTLTADTSLIVASPADTSTPTEDTTTIETVASTSTLITATATPTSATSAPKPTSTPITKTSSTPTPTITAGTNRQAITARLNNQAQLMAETVAVICVRPQTAGTAAEMVSGTGIIVNPNGYLITNGHVLADTTSCFLGFKHDIPEGYQSYGPPPTVAVYYHLDLIAKGNPGVTDPTEDDWVASTHDYAIFKIGDKITKSDWNMQHPAPDITTLQDFYIPLATDAEFSAFSNGVTYPAIAINYNYQPVIGDRLSLGGYSGAVGRPEYTFEDGLLSIIGTSTIVTVMPTGQGDSGSAVVDNNGEMVALNHAADCDADDCTAFGGTDFTLFVYGDNSLAITVSALNVAMKQDLGYGLQQLQTMQ